MHRFALIALFVIANLLGVSQLVSAQDAPSDNNTSVMEFPQRGDIITTIIQANNTAWASDPYNMFAFAVNEDGQMDINTAWSNLPTALYKSLSIPYGVETDEIFPGLQFWATPGNYWVDEYGSLNLHDVFDACQGSLSCDPHFSLIGAEAPGIVRATPDAGAECPSWHFLEPVIWEYQDGNVWKSGVGTDLNPATEFGQGQHCEPIWFFRYPAEN